MKGLEGLDNVSGPIYLELCDVVPHDDTVDDGADQSNGGDGQPGYQHLFVPLVAGDHEDRVGEEEHGHAEQSQDHVQAHLLQVCQVEEEGQTYAKDV